MKKLFVTIGGVVVTLLLFCACGDRNSKKTELPLESLPPQTPVTSFEPGNRDTVVNLSFVGFSLGSTTNLPTAKIDWESTITDDRLAERIVNKDLVLEGRKVNVEIDIITINDTICQIIGIIKRDVYKELVETYVAKYDEPTYGRLEDSYKTDTWARHSWRFSNQSIELTRDAKYDWNLDARPMRKEYFFQEIVIWYEDYALSDRYNKVKAVQVEYDKIMKPIWDSIEAVKAKAVQDSLHEIEHQRRLKDAYQI